MKKRYLFAIIPFTVAILFYIHVLLNPDWIGPDGILHEPFWSKVMTILFFGIGIISTMVLIIRRLYLKNK